MAVYPFNNFIVKPLWSKIKKIVKMWTRQHKNWVGPRPKNVISTLILSLYNCFTKSEITSVISHRPSLSYNNKETDGHLPVSLFKKLLNCQNASSHWLLYQINHLLYISWVIKLESVRCPVCAGISRSWAKQRQHIHRVSDDYRPWSLSAAAGSSTAYWRQCRH